MHRYFKKTQPNFCTKMAYFLEINFYLQEIYSTWGHPTEGNTEALSTTNRDNMLGLITIG